MDATDNNGKKRTHITATLKSYASWITVPISRCLYFVANGLSYLEEGYHHTLGKGGYKLAIPKWEKIEKDLLDKGI